MSIKIFVDILRRQRITKNITKKIRSSRYCLTNKMIFISIVEST